MEYISLGFSEAISLNSTLLFQLKSANAVLDQAQQPYSYLIESIRVREVQIQQLSQQVAMLEEDTQ